MIDQGLFSATTYVLYVETSIAQKFEANIAPLKGVDVLQDLINMIASGKLEVKEKIK